MIKAISFGLDGTLVNYKTKHATMLDIDNLDKIPDNIAIIVTTDRALYPSVCMYAKIFNRKSGYIISDNGSVISNNHKNLFWIQQISAPDVDVILSEMLGNNGEFYFWDQSDLYMSHLNTNYPHKYIQELAESIKQITDYSNPLTKINCLFKNINDLDNFCESIKPLMSSITLTVDKNTLAINITPVIDKGSSLYWLIKSLGIKKEELMHIGDSINDIPAFNLAAISVAMGNSSDKVKKATDYVTFDQDKSGISHILKKLEIIKPD